MGASWKEAYEESLGAHLQWRDEDSREAAYELGRRAIDEGRGLLELSQIHQELLGPALQIRPETGRLSDAAAAAEFFAECAAPFEMLLGGYREANNALKSMNVELEKRVAERTRDLEMHAADLAKSNDDLDRFATLASHDLQEPIRLMGVHASILEQYYAAGTDEKIRESVKSIRTGCSRMRDRLNALLSYSRIRQAPQKLKLVSGEAAFQSALQSLRSAIHESGARITHDDLPLIHSTPAAIATVFEALLSNSIKFCEASQPVISVSVGVRGGETVFSVTDNGIGIPQAYWGKIFVIFQRLHNEEKYPGTGAGLAICKRLVENQGGKIWIEASAPGEGTTFCFTLPSRPV